MCIAETRYSFISKEDEGGTEQATNLEPVQIELTDKARCVTISQKSANSLAIPRIPTYLCLKNRGRTSRANSAVFVKMNVSPASFHRKKRPYSGRERRLAQRQPKSTPGSVERTYWYSLLMKVVHSFSCMRYGMLLGSDAVLTSSPCGACSYVCDDCARGGGFM